MVDERRKSERVVPEKPVSAKLKLYSSGRVLDMSQVGMGVKVRKRLKIGSVYELTITLPDMELKSLASVRRCPLAGFETNEEADRVRVYDAAFEFKEELAELEDRFKPDDVIEIKMERQRHEEDY